MNSELDAFLVSSSASKPTFCCSQILIVAVCSAFLGSRASSAIGGGSELCLARSRLSLRPSTMDKDILQ